jgi:acetyl-CoA carboxylase biotin carboxylase subunit
LPWTQDEITLSGWAMMSRINAEDPWNHFLPAPGPVGRVRLPGGPAVRVDTYVYCRGYVPAKYDPMVAKLTVWGETRRACLQRMQRALEDFTLTERPTNAPLLQHIVHMPQVVDGRYDTELLTHPTPKPEVPDLPHRYQRDVAVAAAVYYLRRDQTLQATLPDRVFQGWHRASRRFGR